MSGAPKRGVDGGGGRGQKRERREGDGIGWQSILIWCQKEREGDREIFFYT